jgi:DnaD/phage-associated family protein
MAFISFADDAAMYDATAFDNMFIIEYMPAAPETFLKVFMYARMLCLHPELGGMEELQRALNVDEETIENAFTYWERAGLVRRVADNPPEYRFLSLKAGTTSDYDRDYYKYRDFNGALQALFPDDRLLHPAQYALANEWLVDMNFSQDAVLAMVKHFVENTRSKSPDPANVFKKTDKKAMQLAAEGITDLAGVERALSRDSQTSRVAREVIKQLGLRRNPSQPEQEMVSKWLQDWGLSLDDILQACAETVKAQNPSFGYLDSILKNRGAGDENRESMRLVLRALGTHQAPTEDHMQWYAQRLNEGFEPAAVEFAAAQQARRKNTSLMGLEKLLKMWQLRGLFTAKAAEEFVARNRALYDEFSALLHAAGLDRPLSEAEVNAYADWKQTLPMDMINYAITSSVGRSDPVRYMASLIGRWQQAGITSLEAAQAFSNGSARAGGYGDKVNPALDYEQRDYSEMDFDDDSFMEEARNFLAGQAGNEKMD